MELTINARNTVLTPESRAYVERRLGHFDDKLGNIMETRIEIIEEPTRSSLDRIQIRMSISGTDITFHTEERADTVRTAVDRTFDSMNKQIEKQRGKWRGKDKGGESARYESPEAAAPAAGGRRIAQYVRMGISPMSLSEALAEADLLKGEMFAFINTDSGSVTSLLKLRPDGKYDLVRFELD
jgi:ribosomal subunit interface protein